jgi:outer membrane biosynthesis protein TonB
VSPAITTRKTLAGGIAALVLALGAAALGQVGGTSPTASVASVARASSEGAVTPAPEPATPTPAPVDTAPPTTQAPAPAAPPTKAPAPKTTATTRKPTTTTVAAAPAAPAPAPTTPTTVKVRSGERVAFTTAGVQAAITALHQRIPLFAPNDAQLRTFADAVCSSFDQGQTQAQVQATIRDAVSRIQGQSLSDADAAFMVQTVTQLRCPGYLP